MLKVCSVFNTEDKKEILKKLCHKQYAWVVSDIKSKEFISRWLTQKKLDSDCKTRVFRARDFWKSLLYSYDSSIRMVSPDLLVFLYQQWASVWSEEWKKTPQAGLLVCEYLKTIAHLLQHNMRSQLVDEWFSALPEQSANWKKWHYLAVDFWDHLKKRGIGESSWSDVFLLDKVQNISLDKWEGMVFDLGCYVNRVELELMRELSTRQPVYVLAPVLWEDDCWKYATQIYSHIDRVCKAPLSQKTKIQKLKSSQFFQDFSRPVRRFFSQLAEVKDIVCEVKGALNSGVPAQKIAVIAPRIEDYWVCLKSYFKKEQIKVNKQEVSLLSSFYVVQCWLARLWTHIGVIEYQNLEMIVGFDKKNIEFSQFRSLYYYASQVKEIPDFCYQKKFLRDKNTYVSGKDFLTWIHHLKPSYPVSLATSKSFSEGLKKCLDEFSQKIELCESNMPYQDWISLLESFFKNQEVLVKTENKEGINCLSFNAVGWLSADVVYIAGLSESNMNQPNRLFSDVSLHSIMDSLGFFIKLDHPYLLEFAIKHLIQQDRKKTILSFSHSDFSGRTLSPSGLWVKWNYQMSHSNKNSNQYSSENQLTSWDLLQRKTTIQEILLNRKFLFPSNDLIEQSIKEDSGEYQPKPYCVHGLKKLSYSSLRDYIACPFVYSAKKLFGLWSGPERDDIDRSFMERGSLIHRLFEKLKANNKNEFSKEELLHLIKNLIKEEAQFNRIKELNPVMREKEIKYLLRKSQIFLKHETQAKNFFKDYQVKDCEVKFKGYWNLKEQSLSKDHGVLFNGVIDRVDSNGSSYKTIDYKGSHPKGARANQWIAKKEFQLALYIQALERGLVDSLPPLPVDISLFLSYKDFSYQGLAVKTATWPGKQSFGKLSQKTKSIVSQEQKEKILLEANLKINQVISNMHQGEFTPHPLDQKECIKCQWRKICRAKHLN